MSKKELIISVLQKLIPYRDMAEGFLVFVQQEECSEESITSLIRHINKNMHIIKEKQISNSTSQIKQKDINEHLKDISEAELLLNNLLVDMK